jgi:hypothetical protein
MPAVNIPLTSDSMIELSHESLMRIWKRLSIWVDDEFESAQMYKRLSDAAAMYQIGKTGLWRPPDLQLALNWQKKQRPTREWAQRYDDTFERAIVFLDTSRITYEAELKNQEMLQRRVLRKARATALILGVAFIVAIGFFLFSYIQKIKADEQTRFAEEARREAEDQKQRAIKQTEIAEEQRKLAVATNSKLTNTLKQLQQALDSVKVERDRAAAALQKAQEEEQKAVIAKEQEMVQKEIAMDQTRLAKENYQMANSLYMLAIAQTLATKSVQEDDDKDLKGLLAMQGYHFHTRYSSTPDAKKYDPYIYEGLYSSLSALNGSSYNAIKAQGPPHVHIKSLVISQKDNSFYTSGSDGRIMRGDFVNLTSVPTGMGTRYPSRTIALSKDENYLVNGSDSTFIQIYDLAASGNKPSYVIKGLNGFVTDIEFLPDGSTFVMSTSGKSLYLANAADGSAKLLTTLPFELKSITIHPNANKLSGASWNGQVVTVNLSDFTFETIADEKGSRVLSIKYSPDGNFLAYGVDDITNSRGVVKLYNLATKEVRQMSGHKAGVTDVEFSADGKLLASAGTDRRLLLWVLDRPEKLPITMANNSGFIWDIAFTKSSDYLIAVCSESEIRVWPTDPALLAGQICSKLSRNLTVDEWKKYVGEGDDLKYEPTCVGLLIKDN